MKVFFKYLLLTFILVSYFQAVLEINNGYISNTFNDDYDTYVVSKDNISSTITKKQTQIEYALVPKIIIGLPVRQVKSFFLQLPKKVVRTYKQKLFIENRSLLI